MLSLNLKHLFYDLMVSSYSTLRFVIKELQVFLIRNNFITQKSIYGCEPHSKLNIKI